MSKEERQQFFEDVKDRVQLLLKNTDQTVATVKQHFSEIDAIPKGAWADKMLIFKKLMTSLFGSSDTSKSLAY